MFWRVEDAITDLKEFDKVNGFTLNKLAMYIKSTQWLASKIDPDKFGDSPQIEVNINQSPKDIDNELRNLINVDYKKLENK